MKEGGQVDEGERSRRHRHRGNGQSNRSPCKTTPQPRAAVASSTGEAARQGRPPNLQPTGYPARSPSQPIEKGCPTPCCLNGRAGSNLSNSRQNGMQQVSPMNNLLLRPLFRSG